MPNVACTLQKKKGRLYFRIIWKKQTFWQKLNAPETLDEIESGTASARVISDEIEKGSFDYLRWFPHGNKAHLFKSQEQSVSHSLITVRSYYEEWLPNQKDRVRAHRTKDYVSIKRHVLEARIGKILFGDIPLGLLKISDLKALQGKLKAKDLKSRSVNGVIHSCLRAMLRDARIDGHVSVNLYDRDFFKPLPTTDTKPSIDPYTPEEREIILEYFRTKNPHYYRFVFFQFWQGTRPSESTALRRGDVDLRYAKANIHRSRVIGKEAGTKTVRSNRKIALHTNTIPVLKSLTPLHVNPEDYFFATPTGAPITEDNFYHREWLPALRLNNIRPRPFYNTRHTYVSFLYSIGATSGFISQQTGDSIKTLESDYAEYSKKADSSREFVEREIAKSENSVRTELERLRNANQVK